MIKDDRLSFNGFISADDFEGDLRFYFKKEIKPRCDQRFERRWR